MTEDAGLGRRPILQAMFAAGAGAFAATEASAAPSAAPGLDLAKPEALSLIFRKLGYALDGRLGFWHLEANRYGLVGAELFPFWRMHIGSFWTTRDLPGGAYEVIRMGVAFYTDMQTGEFMRKFANPLTGKTVDIEYGRPTAKKYAPPIPMTVGYKRIGGVEPPPQGDHALIPTGALGPAWIQSGFIWIQQDNLLLSGEPGKGEIRYNDLTTYFGPLSDVVDPSVKMARAGHAFNDINNWPAWLEMGDHPGDYFSRGMGYKSASYEEMPETWRRLMAQEYPEIAKDPLKALLA
jgi:hypothetical protein